MRVHAVCARSATGFVRHCSGWWCGIDGLPGRLSSLPHSGGVLSAAARCSCEQGWVGVACAQQAASHRMVCLGLLPSSSSEYAHIWDVCVMEGDTLSAAEVEILHWRLTGTPASSCYRVQNCSAHSSLRSCLMLTVLVLLLLLSGRLLLLLLLTRRLLLLLLWAAFKHSHKKAICPVCMCIRPDQQLSPFHHRQPPPVPRGEGVGQPEPCCCCRRQDGRHHVFILALVYAAG